VTQPVVEAGKPVEKVFSVEDRSPATPRAVWRPFRSMASGFWTGDTARTAWFFTGAIVALILANIALQYGINRWNRWFFDALEARDGDQVRRQILVFMLLAATAIGLMVSQVYARLLIQAHWRRWLTGTLVAEWLSRRRFYQLNIVAPEIDNPEFRMTDDVRFAIDPLVDFAIGLSNAVLMAAVFVGVLWTAGGGIEVFGIFVPGYFVLCAAVYAVLTSGLMVVLGRPLVHSTAGKNAAEAQVRFELVRTRENAESIALIGGESDERTAIDGSLGTALRRWRSVAAQQAKMTLIIHGNTTLAPVLPLLLGAPKYLAGSMSLGQLMQIAAAFVQVQIAFNWLVENYIRLAEWQASARRVLDLRRTIIDLPAEVDDGDTIRIGTSPDEALHLRDLVVAHHSGRVVIDGAEAKFLPGEKILLRGDSGTGKSTLIRAIAGLWPWGSGQVLLPDGADLMFVPQKPYVPNGSLRDALIYPRNGADIPDQALLDALHRCGLRRLADDLDREERWDKVLSGGEQQRLAFARLVVHKPAIVVMDEATSALDEASQDSMMSLFRDELAHAMLLSVGHRPGLEDYHDRVIELTSRPMGAVMGNGPRAETGPLDRPRQIIRKLLRPVAGTGVRDR
jgi:putative ATP-binding cassette transporter